MKTSKLFFLVAFVVMTFGFSKVKAERPSETLSQAEGGYASLMEESLVQDVQPTSGQHLYGMTSNFLSSKEQRRLESQLETIRGNSDGVNVIVYMTAKEDSDRKLNFLVMEKFRLVGSKNVFVFIYKSRGKFLSHINWDPKALKMVSSIVYRGVSGEKSEVVRKSVDLVLKNIPKSIQITAN